MAERRDLLFRLLGDSKSLQNAARTSQTSLQKVAGFATKAAGALGALWAGREVVEFAVDMVKLGERTEQLARSAENVLGPALDGLNDRMSDTRKVMGLSQNDFNEIISRLGLMTENVGLADEAQADFIERLVTAAGEAAAFTGNIEDADDALGAMEAAIRGEFDPLERFGVKLKQADINARAQELMNMNSALSEQEARVEATAQLIEEQLAPAYGTLSETADTAAGQIARTEAEMADLRAAVGVEFKKAADSFSLGLGTLLTDFGGAMRAVRVELSDMGEELLNIIGLIDETGRGPDESDHAQWIGKITDSRAAYDDLRLSIEDAIRAREDLENAPPIVPDVDTSKIIAAQLEFIQLRNLLGTLGAGGTLEDINFGFIASDGRNTGV